MNTNDIEVGASAVALGASSASIADKAAHGERLTALDVACAIASAASLALSVWRRQGAEKRRLAGSKE